MKTAVVRGEGSWILMKIPWSKGGTQTVMAELGVRNHRALKGGSVGEI